MSEVQEVESKIETSETPRVDLRKVSEAILYVKINKIQTSPLSKYIPTQSQLLERDRQVARAFRAHSARLKLIQENN